MRKKHAMSGGNQKLKHIQETTVHLHTNASQQKTLGLRGTTAHNNLIEEPNAL